MKTTEKKMPAGAPPKGPGGKRKIDFRQLNRIIRLMFRYYPKMIPVAIVCIVFSAIQARNVCAFFRLDCIRRIFNHVVNCMKRSLCHQRSFPCLLWISRIIDHMVQATLDRPN